MLRIGILLLTFCGAAHAQCIHYEQLPNVGIGQQSLPACDERGRIIVSPLRVERPPPERPDRPPPTRPSNTVVFDCKSFAETGPCGTSMIGGGGQAFAVVGGNNGSTPALVDGKVMLVPANATHVGLSLNYQTLVSAKAFKATFVFVPNGWNIAFVLNNSNNGGFNGKSFSSGAGCEAGFFQGFSQPATPNNVFALEFDSYSPLTEHGAFTYSSVQYYDTEVHADNAPNPPGQSPCNPDLGSDIDSFHYASVTKVSTSPVNLTRGVAMSTTEHVYSATVIYDGSNLFVSLYDVTAGSSCPSETCFTHSWANVDIPAIAGGDMAWVGLTAGTNQAVGTPLLVNGFSYWVP